ncbi:acetyltransferase (GNAT) family protein [Chitinophaga skermanii]|uniref:Acetyltransferase (GNAT) family protein n=1 Tax=Chitinophaga skermanii TaxID=331697 RepID=A0A327QCF5_9BACT|nr:GNAT family N-acetyltransferase [Chitinophaga skermanii]RAJ01655.1 acetyltransferase (GNAT) family protein [Chitinophaga skermanii]
MTQQQIANITIEKWLTGWALSRHLPLPIPYRSGFKVDVGYKEQIARYVFPALHRDFFDLANTIEQPWIHLKVCAPPGALKQDLPERWVILPQGYFMHCYHEMPAPRKSLGNEYALLIEKDAATYVVKIMHQQGELAASGRIVLVDDIAVFDQVVTDPQHQRKGLASIVLKELEKIALAEDISEYCLVATDEGKLLYESLGWEMRAYYTSVVITGE